MSEFEGFQEAIVFFNTKVIRFAQTSNVIVAGIVDGDDGGLEKMRRPRGIGL